MSASINGSLPEITRFEISSLCLGGLHHQHQCKIYYVDETNKIVTLVGKAILEQITPLSQDKVFADCEFEESIFYSAATVGKARLSSEAKPTPFTCASCTTPLSLEKEKELRECDEAVKAARERELSEVSDPKEREFREILMTTGVRCPSRRRTPGI